MKQEKYTVDGKTIDIMKEDWKYLIVLDACRFDYFEKNYKKYFTGVLKKGISSTNNTMIWLNENFSGYYDDTIYLATVPYINSVTETKLYDMTYDGKKHFFKIIDCEWSDELKTIPPETVNKEAILTIKEYPDKRIIIHYLQPHDPFIGENYRKYITKEYSENEVIIKNDKRNKLGNAIKKIVGIQIMWKLGKIFNSETLSPVTLIGMNEGVTGIRKAYEENLNLVLEYVSKLLSMLDGNVLIIGDHGEYLGEHGIYAHATNKRTKEIWEVPYMIIKKEDQ